MEANEVRRITIMGRWFLITIVVTAFTFLYFLPGMGTAQEKPQEKPQVMIAHLGNNNITLSQEPCPLGGWFKEWKKAEWLWDGKKVDACWTISQAIDGYFVATVDAAGAPGMLPAQMFSPKDGAGDLQKQKEKKRPKGHIGV